MTEKEFAFTYKSYQRLLERLRSSDYDFKGYDQEINDGDILLRHDVDWSPKRALRMATIEAKFDVSATYFFLLTSPFYNLLHQEHRNIIRSISDLGHDIGIHFSTHQYWNSEPAHDAIEKQVQAERDVLKTIVEEISDAISFHIPPDWILRECFTSFDSTYAEQFFTEIEYRGDSNQRWRNTPPFADGIPNRVQILVHPGLWGESDASFADRLRTIRDARFQSITSFLEHQYINDDVKQRNSTSQTPDSSN